MTEPMRHRYEIGQHVTLTNGMGAIIESQWLEDDGTPGYGVWLYIGQSTGVHETHISGCRSSDKSEGKHD